MKLKSFVRENTWLPRNSFMDFGWGNGYVILPEDHPMYGKHYDDIPVEVNGGLTYAENVSDMNREYWPEIPEDITSGWVVGFDTAHSWDTLSRWPKEKVERETKRLRLQLERLVK